MILIPTPGTVSVCSTCLVPVSTFAASLTGVCPNCQGRPLADSLATPFAATAVIGLPGVGTVIA